MAEKKPPLKELLLQAGFDSIAAHGWQDLSLRKLASSCKVSHVASYRYFKNKDDLMFALVPRISKHFADFLKESEKEDQAPPRENSTAGSTVYQLLSSPCKFFRFSISQQIQPSYAK